MVRGSILDEAKTIINGERQDTNGNPEDSFDTISKFWNTYINARFPGANVALVPKDATLMMTMFKLARETHQGKKDNLVDAAGYLGISGDFTPDYAKAKPAVIGIVRDTPITMEGKEYHG